MMRFLLFLGRERNGERLKARKISKERKDGKIIIL